MTEIPLANNRGTALIDDADAELVRKYKWYAVQGGKRSHTAYAASVINNKRQTMHRLLMGADVPRVDHKDGNGLNNQRFNLRGCTHAENMRNTRPYRGKRYKGVTYRARSMNWEAYIQPPNGKQIHLGKFPTEESAAQAYDLAAEELFGVFARLNFPPGGAPAQA